MSDWHFGLEIKRRPVNLPRAALCFAREIAYPDLDIAAYLERLAALASDARPGVIAHATPAGQAQALAHFLFRNGPLRGNLMAYADPRNSYLNQVLDRGMGIPISLSVVYLAVAAHLNLPAHGVNLPGHFIVGLDSGDGMIYLDPFHGGQQLTLTDCARLVRQTTGYRGPLRPEWLTPAGAPTILNRMLNNLRLIYGQQQNWPYALAVLERLRLLDPGHPGHLRDLGLVHYQLGHLYQSAQYLDAYSQHNPDAPDLAEISQQLAPVLARWAQQN